MKKLLAYLLTVSAINAADVKLAWDANPPSDLVTKYKVFWGTESNVYTNSMDVVNSVTATVKDLLPGTLYYFNVKAVNSAGESDFTQEISRLIPLELPTVVKGFKITTVTTTTTTVIAQPYTSPVNDN